MFSCKFCKISNKTFSYRTPPVAASGSSNMFLIKWTKIMANFVHARVLLFLWDIRSFLTYMTPYLQIGKKQPSKKLSKKRCFLKSENSQKYACVGVSFLIKSILLNKRLRHRCFPMNFGKFLRTPILKNICERLLLYSNHKDTISIGQLFFKNMTWDGFYWEDLQIWSEYILYWLLIETIPTRFYCLTCRKTT